MSNIIDIEQWLEEDENDLIDGNDIDSEDELGDQENYERARDAREIDDVEIKALIGILILAGISKFNRQNIFNLFDDSKGTGLEILVRNLRFDDFTNRSERSEIDKLAPIRELFEVLVQNFQNYFIPSEYLTLDEQLIAFRGRCSFRQYIPNKPARYGIKIFAIVD
ncbi:piggyBac transposable element-derived protein 4-like, partial [Sipha flava]|uniref:PiggyBac transposable element-derived protein 4-like n=1 Tax=Sipha flava TaxID=143950 RepID=A0A8B8F9Z1_9HEMI